MSITLPCRSVPAHTLKKIALGPTDCAEPTLLLPKTLLKPFHGVSRGPRLEQQILRCLERRQRSSRLGNPDAPAGHEAAMKHEQENHWMKLKHGAPEDCSQRQLFQYVVDADPVGHESV